MSVRSLNNKTFTIEDRKETGHLRAGVNNIICDARCTAVCILEVSVCPVCSQRGVVK